MVSNGDTSYDYYTQLLETSTLLLGMPHHHATQAYVGVQVKVHAFLTSARDKVKRSTSSPAQEKKVPVI
jgi:hypothetical protein